MTAGTGCCGTAPNVNCNISYGLNFAPVSVNNNLFSVPGCTTCSNPILAGTGFDTGCNGYIGGGSSDTGGTVTPLPHPGHRTRLPAAVAATVSFFGQ